MADTCACGNAIKQPDGPGRRRTKCEECSPKRERTQRRQPTVLQLHQSPEPAAAPPPERAVPVGVTGATLTRLEATERLSTPEGAVALHLARLLDGGDYNAQGAAALAKAHAEALARATAGAKDAPDAVDEIMERRAQRRRGA